MRKIKKEKKKVEVEQEVVVSDTLHCDICNKEIKGNYWELYVDSSVYPNTGKDICSKKCLTSALDEYVKDKTNGASFEAYYVKSGGAK